jgi:hypothetical protein
LYSHVVYDRPVYLFWAPVDNFTASSASDYDFHYHGYWAKEWIYDFKDVTFSETNKDGGTPYPYGISPTNGAYYNGLRNEVNWKYGTANSNQEANCVVKCFGSQWDGDEDFYGYGHYDPLQKFDVIPNLEKKENQWLYIERDHSPNISENPSPLNDGCWMSGSYYLDNLSIIIPQNKVI